MVGRVLSVEGEAVGEELFDLFLSRDRAVFVPRFQGFHEELGGLVIVLFHLSSIADHIDKGLRGDIVPEEGGFPLWFERWILTLDEDNVELEVLVTGESLFCRDDFLLE